MIPARRPDQSFEAHQQEVSAWLGASSVEHMNAVHDPLHRALADWLGVTSHAMREAAGEALTLEECTLAALEETAVLHCQRWLSHAGGRLPDATP